MHWAGFCFIIQNGPQLESQQRVFFYLQNYFNKTFFSLSLVRLCFQTSNIQNIFFDTISFIARLLKPNVFPLSYVWSSWTFAFYAKRCLASMLMMNKHKLTFLESHCPPFPLSIKILRCYAH